MTGSRALQGNLAALVASCLLGGAVVATRTAVREIEPLDLAFLRYAIGGVLIAVSLAVLRRRSLRVPPASLPRLIALGALFYALFPWLFNTSLRYTTASRGAVILALMPLFTAMLGTVSRSERLRGQQWLGVMLSIVGVGIVFAESGLGVSGGSRVLIGNTLMLAVAAVGAIYGVLAKPMVDRLGPAPFTALAMLAGAAILLIPAWLHDVVTQLRAASTQTHLLVLYLAIPAGAVAFLLFGFALTRLTPTQAVIYINLNPLVATLLGALLLDEPITWLFAAGFAFVVAGLLLANLNRRSLAGAPDVPRPAISAAVGDSGERTPESAPTRRSSDTPAPGCADSR